MAKKKKKSKKQSTMSSRVKSPSKKQRRAMGHSSGPEFLQPGARGGTIGGPSK